MTARLADERGFTLVELLATMVVAGIILFALFGLVDTATRRQSVATDRIDSNDRARAAMDIVSTQLRSRVCLNATQGSIVLASSTATETVLEFYASLGMTAESPVVSQQPIVQRRRLTYSVAKKTLVEEMWVPPAPEVRTRTLLTNIDPIGSIFHYYALSDPATGLALYPAAPVDLGTTLSADNLAKQSLLNVQIEVGFKVNGRGANVNTPMQTKILDRSPGCFFG
jgi:prepilin-type N-terminal cleavage/methylation domain-containing protein